MKKQRKTLKLNLYFWTNDLPKSSEKTLVWNGGFITLQADKGKKIDTQHIYFNKKSGIEDNIKKLFNRAGVIIVE